MLLQINHVIFKRISEISKYRIKVNFSIQNIKQKFAKKYNVKICGTLDGLLKTDFDFIVSCVNKDGISDMIKTLTALDIPVLTETPVTH